MIADANKRIAQIKSAQSNPEHKFSWRLRGLEEDHNLALSDSLLFLQMFEAVVKQRISMLREVRDKLQLELKRMQLQEGDQPAEQKRSVNLRALFEGPRRQVPDR
ncbi:hypothetical protein Tdes44962_MAKER03860 [Teratosphaeria destructans]|uniref:Uncharacterized protein n=1 Tax=Teratosphaeria destructans TaxID=418781 RepID=A0A9W7W0L9_9PEZI|nr:hypothetical protein Tdes44962_MAKER03860 [Teratosphaeria destructans]